LIVTTTWHHIILDGWSLGLLHAEESNTMESYLHDDVELHVRAAPSLQPYFAWLAQQSLDGAVEQAAKVFDQYESVVYPWDSSSGGEANELYSQSVVLVCSSNVSASIAALASARDISLASLLQELSARTLMYLGGVRDVVFGNVSSGRTSASGDVVRIEEYVGMFVNTVACRARSVNGSVRVESVAAEWMPLSSMPGHVTAQASRLLHVVQNATTEATEPLQWVDIGGDGEASEDFCVMWLPDDPLSMLVSGHASMAVTELVTVVCDAFTSGSSRIHTSPHDICQ
jgi:hypothetical protein